MPIKKENAHKYPKNWKTEIVPAVRARSGDRCEWPGCQLENHGWIVRNPDGSAERLICEPFDRDMYETEGGRVVRVILTTAHLDHNPENCELSNLKHWCQMHHLRYDAQHHAETARATREAEALKVQPLLLTEVMA